MSETYRDDTTELAVASDETWLGLRGVIVEELAVVSAVLLTGIGVTLSDSATASDEVFDARIGNELVVETAQVTETWENTLHAKTLVAESRKVVEQWFHTTGVLHEDSAQISDEIASSVRDVSQDVLVVSEEWSGVLKTSVLLTDTLKLSDTLIALSKDTFEDTALLSDWVQDHLRASVLVTDSAQISDEAVEASSASALITESAAASDEVWGVLHAVQLVTESAQAEGDVTQDTGAGQIWTANSDVAWAMSRYRINATGLSVIDGVPHLTTPEGVFALDGDEEEIEGELVTGKIDLGGTLATPISLYLEYELDGALEVDVRQYQSGAQEETYSYPLPVESADTLTNGRVMFGKGLRGRHFGFTVRVSGQKAYINDMSLLLAQTKRRI